MQLAQELGERSNREPGHLTRLSQCFRIEDNGNVIGVDQVQGVIWIESCRSSKFTELTMQGVKEENL